MDYIAEKLGHPSAEVRGRALESLEFKWKYGLIRTEDLLQDRRVLRGLLGLLGLGDGPQTTAVALLLLRKMAAADTRLAKGLLELGALQQLQATPIRTAPSSSHDAEPFIWTQPGFWPEELLPSVEALAKLLLGFEPQTSAQVTGGPQSSHFGPSVTAAAAAGDETETGLSEQQLMQAAALRRSAGSAVSAGLGSDAAGSPPLAHTHLSSGSLGSAAGGSPGGDHFADTAGSGPSAAAAGVRGTVRSSLGGHHRSASTGSLRHSAAAGAAAAASAGEAAAAASQGNYGDPGPAGPGSGAASGDTSLFDERLLRARARADWRQMEATGASAAGAGVPLYSSSGPPAGHLALPVVPLSAADDQALFELNVRLQYSDDERLLLPALLELAGAVGVDMPAEALLSRPSILDNCLALVGSSRVSRAVQQAAAAALLQLVKGVKQSVQTYQNPDLAHSEYADAVAAAVEAAATGKPVPTVLTSCLNPLSQAGSAEEGSKGSGSAASWPLAGFREAVKTLAAVQAPMLDPSCPNSYPRLALPDLGPDAVWKLPAGALQGAVVDLTAVVASICLQTTELSKHPERHYELLPLLDEALPLLAAPLQHLQHSSDTSQPADKQQQQQQSGLQLTGDQRQQLQQHMQAIWRGLLAALSRALAACAAVGAADRAAAASASLAGGSSALTAAVAAVMMTVPPAAAGGAAALAAGGRADGGLCVWDLPTVNLLMLGLRWINAAPQYWVTPSLVPASLSDTLAAAACDEAVDLVLPQLRQAAQHTLQQLRPGALQALREAHAVPAAWEAGEEALRQLHTLQQQLHTAQELMQHHHHHQQQLTGEVLGVVLGWLDRLQAAFPGLGYAPRWDAKFLQGALHGLSLAAATCRDSETAGLVPPGADEAPLARAGAPAPAPAGSTWTRAGERVGGFVVSLLRHHSPTVQQLVWQLLQSAVAAAVEHSSSHSSSSHHVPPGSPAIQLLLLPKVLECLVVEQLSRPKCKPAACTLLMGLLQHGGSSVAQQLLPWRPWICSCAGDTAGNALNEALSAYLSQSLGQPDQEGFWGGQLMGVLQDLFSVHGEVRRAAGRLLLQYMTAGCDMTQEELEDYTDDPFKGLLGNAPSSTAAATSSSSSGRFLLPPDPLTDASANLAAAFSRQDVVNLLAVLANKGLAQELRRSAAEELLALSPDPHLLAVMVQQQHLDAIWQLCVPPDVDDDSAGDPLRGLGLSSLAVGAGDPSGGIFDMQLPIAGLHLLAGLLARSPVALEWVTQSPDRLLQPLLPLVLHSLNSVRKAVGRVLACVMFGHSAQCWSGFRSAAAAAAGLMDNKQQQRQMPLLPTGVEGVLLPLPFSQQFKFPFKVTWLPVVALPDSVGAAGLTVAAGGETAGDGYADAVPAVQQQHQQRALVRQLVEQQQILQAAAAAAAIEGIQTQAGAHVHSSTWGNAAAIAAAARTLLADCLPAELSHISQRVVAATAANLVLIDPSGVAARCLAAVAAASNHSECTQALWALQQQLGSTSWGLLAVLQNPNSGWLPALSRLLGTAPITREDQQLWLLVLQLVERLLVSAQAADSQGNSSVCTVATYTQLQLLLQRSASVWLQQPAAAAAAPRPPLALAAGSSSWEALRAQPSSASAAAAVADALGLSGSSGAATAVAADSGSSDTTLAVSVSRQALSTLLVLIRAVKRDCSFAVGFYQQQQQSAAGCDVNASKSSSSSSSAAVACYSMSALKPCDLIRLLCGCVVGVTEGVDYTCRVAASAVLCEVLGALQDVTRTQPQATPNSTPTGAAAAGEQQPAGAAGGAASEITAGVPAALLHLTEAWICRVLMPVAGRQLPGFTGKALVRQALRGLCCVVEGPLVCEREWTEMWADIGGTFWLSRLCRDREASIRILALNLTAQLLHPRRTATQALITSNWPDCVHRLMRVSGDVCEAHGVRAAALRGLAAAMVLPLDALQQQQQQEEVPALPAALDQQAVQQQQDAGQEAQLTMPSEAGQAATGAGASSAPAAAGLGAGVGAAQQIQTAPARVKKLHGFGLAPLLQAEAVWQQLLPQLLLKWQQQPPGLTAAAAVLAAVAAAAEPDGVGRQLLLTSGLAAAAVAIAAAAAAEGACAGSTPRELVSSVAEADTVAAVLQQQCDRLDAAAAALQLLALVSANASSGGGLLPLPVSVQAVIRAAPTAAVRLMCSIGASLQAQQQAVNQAFIDNSGGGADTVGGSCSATGQLVRGDAGAVVRLQQQQLTAFRVAAAALSATAGTWPESVRRQQLLPLLQTASQASSHDLNSSSSSGSATGVRGCSGELLCAVAVVLAHPACCKDLTLTCTQLLGLLLSGPELTTAALGSTATAAPAAAAGDGQESEAASGGSDGQAEAVFVGGSSSSSDGEAIGAVLCRDLAGQLPSSIFLPSTLTATAQPLSSTAAAAGANASSSSNSKLTAVLGSTPAWATAAAADSPGQVMVAPPEGLVVMFALQNLLGFSHPAKAAALGIGLHKLLMEAALSMAAAATGPAAATAAGGSSAVGAKRTRARWFSTAPAAPALPATTGAGAAGVMAGPSKEGNTGTVAFGRGGGHELPSFSAVAGVKRPSAAAAAGAGAGGGTGTSPSIKGKGATAGTRKSSLSLRSAVKMKQRQQEQQEQTQVAQEEQQQEQQAEKAVAVGASQLVEEPPQQQAQQEGDIIQQPQQLQQQQQQTAGVPPAADEASQHVSQLQQQLRQQQERSEQQVSCPGAADGTVGAATAAAAGGGSGGGLSKQQLQAACKQLNLRKLLMSVVLLRHLAHGCHDTQAALTADGVVDMVLKLWPLALQHTLLLLELTRLLANTLPSCYEARLAAATLPGPPVSPVCAGTTISCLVSLLVGQQLTPQLQQAPAAAGPAAGSSGSSAFAAAAGTAAVVRAAAVVLLGYASTDDGAATLVKAGASCLSELAKAVRACIVSARRESETQQQRQLNSERLAAVLQLLAVLAGRPDGQRAMLRATVAPVLLELCTEVLQLPQQQPAVAAALLLLRNLSFNPEVRTPLLANGALLPLLLAAAESLLAVLPAAERQQWQQRLTAADQELSAAAAELGCDCRPPKWDPMYEALGPGGGVGSGAGAGAAATTAAKLAAGGSSSRPGSPLVLGAGGAAVPSAAGNVCCAVYAVSALWALVHTGEKVKAGLRKLPAASARLGVVKGYAEELLKQQQQTQQQQQQQKPGLQLTARAGPVVEGDSVAVNVAQQQLQKGSRLGPQRQRQQQQQQALMAAHKAEQRTAGDQLAVVGQAGAGVQQEGVGSAGGGAWVGAGSLCGEQTVGWWLQQLQDSCGALLDLMDAC